MESGRLWILEADVTAPTDSASARNRVGVVEFEISWKFGRFWMEASSLWMEMVALDCGAYKEFYLAGLL